MATMINCEECPFFEGGVFRGFKCAKEHALGPESGSRFLFRQAECKDFRPMTLIEQIMRRWRHARSHDLKNRGSSVKRLVSGLRNQLREGELGQYLTSDQVADLRAAASALEKIADHIHIASKMLKKKEEQDAEDYRRAEAEKRDDAGRLFFGDAEPSEMVSMAFDLSDYLHARHRCIGNIKHAATRFQDTGGDPDRRALIRAVGEEVYGFGDVTSPHYFHSNRELTLTDFRAFREAQAEKRRVDEMVTKSPNVVLLKKKIGK